MDEDLEIALEYYISQTDQSLSDGKLTGAPHDQTPSGMYEIHTELQELRSALASFPDASVFPLPGDNFPYELGAILRGIRGRVENLPKLKPEKQHLVPAATAISQKAESLIGLLQTRGHGGLQMELPEGYINEQKLRRRKS